MKIRFVIPTMMATFALLASPSSAQKSKTIKVDCSKGQSINKALEDKADELIIEISGMCEENVLVERHNVTLRGGDPAGDGIRAVDEGDDDVALTIAGTLNVAVENLRLTGGERGLTVNNVIRGSVHVRNCNVEGNSRMGLKLEGGGIGKS